MTTKDQKSSMDEHMCHILIWKAVVPCVKDKLHVYLV